MARMKPEDFTQFKLSKPWGYYPPDVEEQIRSYEETIQALTNKYLKARQAYSSCSNTIEQLQDELREMHLQMSSLELPDAAEAIEHYVLDDFKDYNSNPSDNDDNDIDDIPLNIVDDKKEYNEQNGNNSLNQPDYGDDEGDELSFIIVK